MTRETREKGPAPDLLYGSLTPYTSVLALAGPGRVEAPASGRHCASDGMQAEVAPWGGMMNLKGKGLGGGGSKRKTREMPKAVKGSLQRACS